MSTDMKNTFLVRHIDRRTGEIGFEGRDHETAKDPTEIKKPFSTKSGASAKRNYNQRWGEGDHVYHIVQLDYVLASVTVYAENGVEVGTEANGTEKCRQLLFPE